jgi:polyisoprenyl-phosphate glycosyltransferase
MAVTVIIPAYNEEKTISDVIEIVRQVELIDQIIVVSDGSTDKTAEIARQWDVKVLELNKNVGKGGALTIGFQQTQSSIILFLDADLIGLKSSHITDLLLPVLHNRADMAIGIFSNGRLVTDLAQKFTPYLSGQRAMKREIFENVSGMDMANYGVEVALTRYVEKQKLIVKHIILQDLTHIMKEEKLGVIRGFKARLKMYRDILRIIRFDR